MGKRGPKPKPVAAPPLKAKGKGPVKRTPTSSFDAAANDTGCHCLKEGDMGVSHPGTGCHCLTGGDMGVSHPAINSLLIEEMHFKTPNQLVLAVPKLPISGY